MQKLHGVTAAVLLATLLSPDAVQAAAFTDLALSAASRSFRANASGIYAVTVTNRGPATTDAPIRVSARIADSLRFVGASGTGWSCTASGTIVTCTNASALPVNATTGFEFTVRVGRAAFPSVTSAFALVYTGDTNAADNSVEDIATVSTGPVGSRPRRPRRPRPGRVARNTIARAATSTPTPTLTQTPTATPPSAGATDVILTAAADEHFTVGAIGTYTLTVINAGPAPTNATLTITDTLPSGVTLDTAGGTAWICSLEAGTVTCARVETLAVGTQTTLTLTVNVDAAAVPAVTNAATLAYAGDIDTSNNTVQQRTTVQGSTATATATGGVPTATATRTATRTGAVAVQTPTPVPGTPAATDLSLSGTNLGAYRVGKNAFYFISITNMTGVATNQPIFVRDVLPDGLGFVSADGDGWTCMADGQTVDCTHADALPGRVGKIITLTLSVAAPAAPSVTNIPSLSYAGDTNPANNSTSTRITVRP